jgi:tetratricopeptide (TPR) repeat protein
LAYTNRGSSYLDKKEYDRAIADYNQAIRLNANYDNPYSGRAIAYYYKGDLNRAITDCEMALKINPNNTYAKNNLEIFRRQRGR